MAPPWRAARPPPTAGRSNGSPYEPLLSTSAVGRDGVFGGSSSEEAQELLEPEDLLLRGTLRGEPAQLWGPAEDLTRSLDKFLLRLYQYYQDKGFSCIVVSRVLNLLTLAFTIGASGFLLLAVDWRALLRGCPPAPPAPEPAPAALASPPPPPGLGQLLRGAGSGSPAPAPSCDILSLVLLRDPLSHLSPLGRITDALVFVYLAIFSLYWLWSLVRFGVDLGPLLMLARFVRTRLGVSERDLRLMPWWQLVDRMAALQRAGSLRLGPRPLTAHDVASRILRKENYLIGLINKRVLDLTVPLPGLRRRQLLTKTLEWNLHWAILDCLFDDSFLLRADFVDAPRALQRRLFWLGALNLVLSPFLGCFLLVYFFLRNAERFYRQPGAVGARRWSALAKWRLRELNELPHLFHQRLNAAHAAALRYREQFPSPILSMLAKFVSFVAGAAAAALLGLALLDERSLEAQIGGRALVWYGALIGTVLAVARGFVGAEHPVTDPEAAMAELATHTHYLPRRWLGRCHTQAVQKEFDALFANKAALFIDEMWSVVATPLVLWATLPRCAPAVCAFVRDFTVHVEGLGHVCSLATFDFERHGDPRYGAPAAGPRPLRCAQGKLEKSLVAFAAAYPTWQPPPAGQAVLDRLAGFSATADGSGTRGGGSREGTQREPGSGGPSGAASGSLGSGAGGVFSGLGGSGARWPLPAGAGGAAAGASGCRPPASSSLAGSLRGGRAAASGMTPHHGSLAHGAHGFFAQEHAAYPEAESGASGAHYAEYGPLAAEGQRALQRLYESHVLEHSGGDGGARRGADEGESSESDREGEEERDAELGAAAAPALHRWPHGAALG